MKFNVRDLLLLTTLVACYAWFWQRLEISFEDYGEIFQGCLIPVVSGLAVSFAFWFRAVRPDGDVLLRLRYQKSWRTCWWGHVVIVATLFLSFVQVWRNDSVFIIIYLPIAVFFHMMLLFGDQRLIGIEIKEKGICIGEYNFLWNCYEFTLQEAYGQTRFFVKHRMSGDRQGYELAPEVTAEEIGKLQALIEPHQPDDLA